MNTFGKFFRVHIYGESHNKSVGIIIDGCPAGIPLDIKDFAEDLSRRKGGFYGTTQRVEHDIPDIHSGVFNGMTTGSPIMIVFENRDTAPSVYESIRYTPRPGHSDLAAHIKYNGYNDYRGGGHASGRLTVGIVAAGVIAKKILGNIHIKSSIAEIGGKQDFKNLLEEAVREGDSLGGIIECTAENIPVGIGEPFFDSLESLLSHILFSIPGIKGVEFGSGFKSAKMRGSEYNDRILDKSGKTLTNNSGGINAGISNGNDISFRVAVRPTPSIKKEQDTIDLRTNVKTKLSLEGRHDACFCLRLPVIIDAATAIVLADLLLFSTSA